MKKHIRYICIPIIFLIFVSGFYFSNYFDFQSLRITSELSSYLNDQWVLVEKNEKIDLPTKLDVPKDTPYSISRILDDEFFISQIIGIRGSLQEVEVRLDDELIYKAAYKSDGVIRHPMVSAWHLVEIPEGSNGKELKITLSSHISDMSGLINEIFYGSRSDLNFHIQQVYGWGFFSSIMIFIFGIIIIIFSIVIKPLRSWQFINLGLFTVFISLWLIAESRMLQFFIGSPLILGSLAYIMLSIFPIPILFYIKENEIQNFKKIYNTLIAIFLVNLLLILFLQFSGLVYFYDSVRITHFLILIGLILLIVTLLLEGYKYKNNSAKRILISFGIFSIFGLLEMIDFYFNDYTLTSFYVRIGLIMFILIQVMESIFKLIHYVEKSLEAEHYEQLAYQDRVTGGLNRMAFEKDLENIFSNPDLRNHLRLMIFDLNGLKNINDNFGHVEGDYAIKSAYNLLSDSFDGLGLCYRIGGDEYACVLTSSDVRTIEKRVEILNEKIKDFSKTLPYIFWYCNGFNNL
ncbi:diguanylate cyclase (GGDEF)-like protein [Acetoanaerobium pronyense]|uniref:Diguanylate cyclase (GGDEF)-like protein n=1 Tax=Acetoanaerobium pronyense TaxID=1482736 RepID=A0ABS4KMR8_9FIRM|nr:GGDEF domain-containing protein [Acetoanaerobium pronyense]MBP2029073.1 diguanylate cyclase (GGDEF)-like protein [Acetoanaerobium pronyense]